MIREYRIRKLKQQLAKAEAKSVSLVSIFDNAKTIPHFYIDMKLKTDAYIGETKEKLRQLEKPVDTNEPTD